MHLGKKILKKRKNQIKRKDWTVNLTDRKCNKMKYLCISLKSIWKNFKNGRLIGIAQKLRANKSKKSNDNKCMYVQIIECKFIKS